jgi:hypothetical protein
MKKNSRNHMMVVGNTLLTNMTSKEAKKLSSIMGQAQWDPDPKIISVTEYIERYNPVVRYWTSKSGTEMIAVQILHDIIDRDEDEMSFPKVGVSRNRFWLK